MTKRLLVVLLVLTLTFQAQVSKAFFPLIAAVVAAADAASVTTTTIIGASIGVGLAGLIGTNMGMLSIRPQGSDSNGITYNLPLTTLPQDRPTDSPNAPSTVSPTSNPTYTTSGQTYPSQTSACTTLIAQAYPDRYSGGSHITFTATTQQIIGSSPNFSIQCSADQFRDGDKIGTVQSDFPITINSNSTCATGYTLSNGTCNLTQPEKIPDHNCNLNVQTASDGSHTYISNSNDPECGGGALLKDGHFVQHFQASLPPEGDPSGTPKPYDIVLDSGFWSFPPTLVTGIQGTGNTVTITSQPTDRSTPTRVTTINTVDGVVTSASATTVAGNIAQAGTTYTNALGQSVTVGANDIVIVNPATVGNGQVVAPSTSFAIPTDYARAGEASTAANTIKDKLAETEPMDDLTEPTLTNPLTDYFNPLRSWSVPTRAGECPAGSFNAFDHTYSLSSYCTIAEQHLPSIQAVMSAIYLMLGLFIVLRA